MSTDFQRHSRLRERNKSFGPMPSFNSASKLKNYRIIAGKAFQNIYLGEELHIDYDPKSSFL